MPRTRAMSKKEVILSKIDMIQLAKRYFFKHHQDDTPMYSSHAESVPPIWSRRYLLFIDLIIFGRVETPRDDEEKVYIETVLKEALDLPPVAEGEWKYP